MPDASILALMALLVGIAILLVLLLRRPPADPAIALLQGTQERQGERLAALPGEIALRSSEVAEKLSAAILDQTKALNAALREQAEATARHRATQAEAEAALKRDMEAGIATLKLTVEGLRTLLAEAETRAQQAMAVEAEKTRAQVEAKLTEMREANDKRLADIQKSVNEQLQSAVEKQMAESFNRVIDQFAAVQKAMGDVQAVTAQIGDLKRLFSNVKTRGGWGEAQVKALLDDILPEGGYVLNLRTREDTTEAVEFGVVMPNPGGAKLYLPIDAKFPAEDYDRLLLAAESGDAEGERQARRALGERVRRQAGDIAQKYINPPITVEFAVLYLPTDSLFAEVARIPGLLEEIGRVQRVLVLGPSLLPAMLRTIQLGHVSLALSENAQSVRELLGATKAEMQKMDDVLKKLGKQAGTFGRTIETALVRTRAIGRKLRGVDAVNFERSEQLLELEAESSEGEEDEES